LPPQVPPAQFLCILSDPFALYGAEELFIYSFYASVTCRSRHTEIQEAVTAKAKEVG